MDDGQKTPRGHPEFNSYMKILRIFIFRTDRQPDRDINPVWAGYQSKISGPKNVSYDAQIRPIIVKSPSAASGAQATDQITNRHYEEVKSSCPDSQTLNPFLPTLTKKFCDRRTPS
jgi:hypothetical protein